MVHTCINWFSSDRVAHSLYTLGATEVPQIFQLLQKVHLQCFLTKVFQILIEKVSLKNAFSRFTTAPILWHSEPNWLFAVEVDALKTEVSAVLSQSFGEKPKLHPVAFFSKKLLTAKHNYNSNY